jgi:hypothetical protein
MEHAKAVLDAAHLREEQHVLMASGRAAKVVEIGPASILFEYLDSRRHCDRVEVQRHRIPELVRV